MPTIFLGGPDFADALFPPTAEFTLAGDISINGALTPGVELRAIYDRHATLRLAYDNPKAMFELLSGGKGAELCGADFPKPVTLLPVSRQLDTTVFLPQIQPVLWSTGGYAKQAHAIFLNGPSLEFCGGRVTFVVDPFQIHLEEIAGTRAFRKQAKLYRGDTIATAEIVIRRTDGAPISPDDALNQLSHLTRFFSFVRGAASGAGNIVGVDDGGATVFAHLGFQRADGFSAEDNWCDPTLMAETPKLYGAYCRAMAEAETARVLLRAIDYYRAANVGRAASAEMALVASYAALETFVPHILSSKAGWSDALLGAQTRFADKLRAAAAFVGLKADPLQHAPHLTARAKAEANGDPFDVLALFRNRITHHKKTFSYTSQEIFETWLMAQWLCELFVFYLLEYRGEMGDRRHYSRWVGKTGPIPLP